MVHALRDCSTAKSDWKFTKLLIGERIWSVKGGCEWLALIWDSIGNFKKLIFIVSWLIWYGRNSFLFEWSPWSASSIVDKAESLLAISSRLLLQYL